MYLIFFSLIICRPLRPAIFIENIIKNKSDKKISLLLNPLVTLSPVRTIFFFAIQR
jgi:hypothetical protein